MYRCDDCGLIFDRPKEYSEDCTPGGAFEGGSFINHYTGCPECSGGYTEVMPCVLCGDNYVSVDEDPYCEACIHNMVVQLENLIKENFREDSWDILLDHLDDIDLDRKEK